MAINKIKYKEIISELEGKATLVAVSKTKPVEDILELYHLGQRDFGENYVQELLDKETVLPKDIRWHFIGHLQSNKVKYIVPFIHLIHGVDSESLLKEINKQAAKNNRAVNCLLQIHIATEETKFGFNENEIHNLKMVPFENAKVKGLMGMASFSGDLELVRSEFKKLQALFQKCQQTLNLQPSTFSLLSMGMSGDYKIALEEGSNMIRIGSLLFGERNYPA